jgi:hypothetical protein
MDIPDENGILGTESKMTQVTMDLTDKDIERIKYLCDVLGNQNKAQIDGKTMIITKLSGPLSRKNTKQTLTLKE